MIWGYQTTVLGNIQQVATTNSRIRLAPQKWPKNLESTCFVAGRHCFFSNGPVDRRVFWETPGFPANSRFGWETPGLPLRPEECEHSRCLGVSLQVVDFLWRRNFFVGKIHVGVFFWVRKWRAIFQVPCFFFRKWTILAWPSVTRIICWIKLAISPGFQPVSTLFVGSSSEISESHWLCLLQRLIPYWF